MTSRANTRHGSKNEISAAPGLDKFVKETVDDALSLLGHGQALPSNRPHTSSSIIALPGSLPGAIGPARQGP